MNEDQEKQPEDAQEVTAPNDDIETADNIEESEINTDRPDATLPPEEMLSPEEMEAEFKRLKKEQMLIRLPFILVFLVWLYGAVWYFGAIQIKIETERFISESAKEDVQIDARLWSVYGFPQDFTLRLSGKVTYKNLVAVSVPELIIKSGFFPGARLHIIMKKGAQGLHPLSNPDVWSIDRFVLKSKIPSPLPRNINRDSIAEWRSVSKGLEIGFMQIDKDDITLKGRGRFSLDGNLQPAGQMDLNIYGIEEFVLLLKDRDIINTKQMVVAMAALSGFSQIDEKSGEAFISAELSIKNRTLFLGPLQLASLNPIYWPLDSQIDLLR